MDNVGANPGETLTDNVWAFLLASYTMMYRGRDVTRLGAAEQTRLAKLYDGATSKRTMAAPNQTHTAAQIFVDTMLQNGKLPPHGSKLFLKANFTAADYPYLLTTAQGLGDKYKKSHLPAACTSMPLHERRGIEAFEEGMDYLPNVRTRVARLKLCRRVRSALCVCVYVRVGICVCVCVCVCVVYSLSLSFPTSLSISP